MNTDAITGLVCLLMSGCLFTMFSAVKAQHAGEYKGWFPPLPVLGDMAFYLIAAVLTALRGAELLSNSSRIAPLGPVSPLGAATGLSIAGVFGLIAWKAWRGAGNIRSTRQARRVVEQAIRNPGLVTIAVPLASLETVQRAVGSNVNGDGRNPYVKGD